MAGCGSSGSASTMPNRASLGPVRGAGAAAVGPVVEAWGAQMGSQGPRVEYREAGAGESLARLQSGAIEFAGVDAAAGGAETASAEGGGSLVRVPLVLGAVTVSYNVVGLEAGLKLDGRTLADIFLGKIRFWNDSEIARLNPGIALPPIRVWPIYRSDPSAATAVFTRYLSEHSRQWRRQVGSGRTVRWPGGLPTITVASSGGPLVYRARQVKGAITYIELPYALKPQPCCVAGGGGIGKTAVAAVQNSAGEFVVPDAKSVAAGTYPFPSVEYALVPRDLCRAGASSATASAVGDFLGFALGRGQAAVEKLHYAPLSADLLGKARAEAGGLTCDGKPLSSS